MMSNKCHFIFLSLFILFIIPSVAWAEVSDKIISIGEMIIYGIILSVIAVLMNWRYKKIFVITLIVTLYLASPGVATVLDEHVGPAAIREQGKIYSIVAYLSFIAVVLSNIAGLLLSKKNK